MESTQSQRGEAVPTFRLDVQLHSELMQLRPRAPLTPAADAEPRTLPQPPFPRRPELLRDDGVDYAALERSAVEGKRKWTRTQILHALRGWALPYVKSRLLPGDPSWPICSPSGSATPTVTIAGRSTTP